MAETSTPRTDLPENLNWEPPRTGDWAADNRTGRDHADRALDALQRDSNPMPLVAPMRAMIVGGDYGGAEAGFVHAVAERLLIRP